jgi:hypothetical protein
LDTYLNDHLAGSVGAVELLDHLLEVHQRSQYFAFLSALREDIGADQLVLQGFIRDLGSKESDVRKAGAWVAEKFSRMKLRLESDDDGFGLFLTFEAIALGISGKEALWKALAAADDLATDDLPELQILDYEGLVSRARDQFERVEAKRLELARQALSAKKANRG